MMRLRNSTKRWVEEEHELEDLVSQHLFKSRRGNMNEVLNCIPQTITQKQNRAMTRPINRE